SLTFENFSRMVSDIRFIEAMLRSPVDKNEMAHQLAPLRDLFTKSIVAADDLPAGHPLTRDDLDFKKPGTGIPAASVRQVIGRVLRQPVKKNHILEESDFSPHGPETL
ncbi:MAG: SAF domain-containing protein, partial [Chloroflexota bacterium]